eukprot:GSMAST32.ASY1.ANO1.946.1 assembled CDS
MAPQSITLANFPEPRFRSNIFFEQKTILNMMSIFFVFAFCVPVKHLLNKIVYEHSGIKEGMKMMGMNEFALVTSWLITYGSQIILTMLMVSVAVKMTMFANSSIICLFGFFSCFSFSVISFCYMMSGFFSKATTAGVIGALAFFCSFFVYFAVNSDSPEVTVRMISFSGTASFAMGLDTIALFEKSEIGMTSETLMEFCIHMLIDSALYILIGFYVDKVVPKERMISLHPLFFILPSFWYNQDKDPHFEPLAPLQMKQLENQRSDGTKKVAVAGLNAAMFEGQIYVLLGHNGAGKTTTISMLSTVFGYNHNVLYADLTCMEHLMLYSRIKLIPSSKRKAQCQQLLKDVGLSEKTNMLTPTLSGGQKRKLCLAIALCGDSKVLFLDEPTSGMDVFAQRSTWNLLQKAKASRIIILTTHSMEEADVLGDRIGIMANGKMVCSGSPLFLKNLYGVDVALEQAIMGLIPSAKKLSEHGKELSYQLPLASASSFERLFEDLGKLSDQGTLDSFNVSVTTMQEVFLRSAIEAERKSFRGLSLEAKENEEKNANAEEKSRIQRQRTLMGEEAEKALNNRLKRLNRSMICVHFVALLAKRWHNVKRDFKAVLFQVIVPIFALFIGIYFVSNVTTEYNAIKLKAPYSHNTRLPFTMINPSPKVNELISSVKSRKDYQISGSDFDAISVITKYDETDEWYATNMPGKDPCLVKGSICYPKSQSQIQSIAVGDSLLENKRKLKTISKNEKIEMQRIAFCAMNKRVIETSKLDASSVYSAMMFHVAGFMVVFIVGIAWAFIPAAAAEFIVHERYHGVKHQQLVSGVSLTAYWLSNFFWDSIQYTIPAGAGVAIFLYWDIDVYTRSSGNNFMCHAYLLSRLFEKPAKAVNSILVMNVLLVIVIIAIFVAQTVNASSCNIASNLRRLFLTFPGYAFVDGLLRLSLSSIMMTFCSLLYPILCILIELFYSVPTLRKLFCGCFEPSTTDKLCTEVKNMKKNANVSLAESMVEVRGLRKVYNVKKASGGRSVKAAVKDMWFRIPQGECFGLLGVNGAGKSTTFKMLSGDVLPSSGTARLGGRDVMSEQHNALLPRLTVIEHLYLFARIKGVTNGIDLVVKNLLKSMDLVEFTHKRSSSLSGGNKRKLCVAIALIGNPPVIFLDEPSAGMDPVAKRFMWDLISKMSTENSEASQKLTIILTTHSMEECSALCTRIGIMVDGRLQCLGSEQHLKNRFGQGYQLDIKLKEPTTEEINNILDTIRKTINPAGHILSKDIDKACSALGDIGRSANDNKTAGSSWLLKEALTKEGFLEATSFARWWLRTDWTFAELSNYSICCAQHAASTSDGSRRQKLFVEEYALGQTSLEQIFISFAKKQENDAGNVKGFK